MYQVLLPEVVDNSDRPLRSGSRTVFTRIQVAFRIPKLPIRPAVASIGCSAARVCPYLMMDWDLCGSIERRTNPGSAGSLAGIEKSNHWS
jgi:hypothetical protein